MKNFKKRYGKKIASSVFIVMWIMAIFQLIYWVRNPELTTMQVAQEFWYFIPMWIAMFVVVYAFDGSNDIHV